MILLKIAAQLDFDCHHAALLSNRLGRWHQVLPCNVAILFRLNQTLYANPVVKAIHQAIKIKLRSADTILRLSTGFKPTYDPLSATIAFR